MGLFSRSEPEKLASLSRRAERAAVKGQPGKSLRLAARAGRAQDRLEARTGRRWESWGEPEQD